VGTVRATPERSVNMFSWIFLMGCQSDPKSTKDSAPVEVVVEEADPEWVTVMDLSAWQLIEDPQDDPFSDHRPDGVECSELGYHVEGAGFEVETDDCPYGTFQQPLLQALPVGTPIKAVLWHLDLWAAKPAEGHVALTSEHGLVLYEDTVAIPGASAVYPIELTLEEALEEGSLLYFHIHNHGFNSWSLGETEAFVTPTETL